MNETRNVLIREGKIQFFIPDIERKKGPLTKKTPAFYNPLMEFSRDISCAAISAFKGRKQTCLDAFSGTGVRGLRYIAESGVGHVTLNDWNPGATKLIKKSAENMSCDDKIEITQLPANTVMSQGHYDIIDIDPFGTPMPFFHNASTSVKTGGMVAMSATDTAPLCGTYPKVCLRRYHATPLRGTVSHEIGLRILIGSFIRESARYDMAAYPLLSYYADHYFRVFFGMKRGSARCDEVLKSVRTATVEISPLAHIISANRAGNKKDEHTTKTKSTAQIGPLWLGALAKRDFLEKTEIPEYFGTQARCHKYIELLKTDCEMPPLFYTISDLSSAAKVSPPTVDAVIERVTGQGMRAHRTHFNPEGIKTDATPAEMISIVDELSKNRKIRR